MRSALLFALAIACEPDSRHPGVERGPMPSSALTVCAAGPTVKGVDVSHWEGAIDWNKVAASGQAFGIAKATEGLTFKDPLFQANYAAIQAAGMVRGAYHFFRPADDGTQQADFFLRTVGSFAEGDLPPILDWEVTDGVASAIDVSGVQAFVDEIHARTGLTTILYTSASFLGTVGNPGQFGNLLPLWDAHWNVTCPSIPSSWTTWTFWQYASTAVVPGIDGGVDVNEFNGTLDQLKAMTGPGEPATTPDAGTPDAGVVEDAGPLDQDAGHSDAGLGIPAPDAGPGQIGAASVGCRSGGLPPAVLLLLIAAFSLRRRSTSAAAPRCTRSR